jgi:hypothetical protein
MAGKQNFIGCILSADDFLQVYETKIGSRVEILGFWELAAAVKPKETPKIGKLRTPPVPPRTFSIISFPKL